MNAPVRLTHSTAGDSLADILERVLNTGVVIAGDVKLKIVDIELLTIQVRLVITSVDKAVEMGLDWWRDDPNFCARASRRRMRNRARPARDSAAVAGESSATGTPALPPG
jgi:hypothetical protein